MAELQPGPELDALVAEKVMEWVRRNGSWYDTFRPPYRATQEQGYWVTALRRKEIVSMFSWFCPSTSVADAWEAVEKLRAEGRWWSIENCEAGWNVQTGPTLLEQVVAVAPTAPHAICLAALKAVGAIDD